MLRGIALMGAAAIAVALNAVPARATMEDATAVQVYAEYNMAIAAAEKCRHIAFSPEEYQVMADWVHARIDHRLGARRVAILYEAKWQMREAIRRRGCDAPIPTQFLALYDRDLAPVVGK